MSKLNQILLGLFALQLLGIVGMRLGSDDDAQIRAVKLIENMEAEKVTALEIWGPPKEGTGPEQNKVKLAKTGTKWSIAGADNFPADGKKVDEFIKKLAKLRSRTTVLTKATYHKKLEVTEDKFQRRVTLTHDGKEIRFYMGTSPSFKNTHVRLDKKNDVLLLNDLSASDVGDRAYHWVNREYVKFAENEVWSVKLKNAKGEIALEKNPQDNKWVESSITKPLKSSVVTDIVKKAREINLETPVGKTIKPEYGLDNPTAMITMVTGTATTAGMPPLKTLSHTIKIGKKLDGENRYYVKASTSEYVVKVANWGVTPLVEKGKADLIEEEKKEEKKKP